MPFLGKDWRSSGDYWIRTELGWERTKVLECILDNLNTGLKKENLRSKKKQSKRNSSGLGDQSMTRVNSECDEEEPDDPEAVDNEKQISDNQSSTVDQTNDTNRNDNDDDEDDDEQFYDDLLYSSDLDESTMNECNDDNETTRATTRNKKSMTLRKLCISTTSLNNYKTRQPHIIYLNASLDMSSSNRENNAPKASVSEVLNALDMPGAVKDVKRFNYVCKLVQLIINEKLNQLSGNAQRTLFMIVKELLFQVIRTQENLNVMRKLLIDFKKKIQDSYFYYFYYIGSQKLCERHLNTINTWQEMLENPNHKRVKRLLSTKKISTKDSENSDGSSGNTSTSFDSIPVDCKLEIMRRINTGLDLVNLAKCSRSLNDIISKELAIWKNLCQFHFQQAHINSLVVGKKPPHAKTACEQHTTTSSTTCSGHKNNPHEQTFSDLDWKLIYFKLKRRYGHREVYVDMIHKCFYCKSLYWKEIGHPCVIAAAMSMDQFEIRSEPITPKKLIDLLLK